LNDEEETDPLAALMRLDFARLNEVMAVFRRFIKSAEGNPVSYSNILPMLEKLMAISVLCMRTNIQKPS
jgi:hypothetical protein